MAKKITLLLLIIAVVVLGWALYKWYMDYETVSQIERDFDKIDHSKDINYISYESSKKPKLYVSLYSPLTYYEQMGKHEITEGSINIISADERWGTMKLYEVYRSFLKNIYGKELKYLDSIILLPESDWPSDIDAGGYYTQGDRTFQMTIRLDNYILPDNNFHQFFDKGRITLLVENKTKVSEILRTLAHEYGHHYTMFHMDFGEYKKVRGVEDNPKVKSYNNEEYKENHRWDVFEIAAEDYVQLMGYYEKEITEYIDVEQALKRFVKTGYDKNVRDYEMYTVNVYPQENFYLPLANEVEGLDDYFFSFINTKPDKDKRYQPGLEMKLSHKKISNTKWELTWTPTEEDDNDILYTLVMYKEIDGDPMKDPVKTVKGSEELRAFIGKARYTTSTLIYTWDDNRVRSGETAYFKVFALYPSGYIASSELHKIDF